MLVQDGDEPADAFAALDGLLSQSPQFTHLRRVAFVDARVRTLDPAQSIVVDVDLAQKTASFRAWLPRLSQRGVVYCEDSLAVGRFRFRALEE